MASNGVPTSTSTKHRSCADIVTAARMRSHEKRARRTKQPWITLKLAVGIAGALIAYACYVYIGRLCVPMIKRNGSGDALGGRGTGDRKDDELRV
ncbi:hypothetical protein HETIRDRAFT_321973 [Heterobasidion irregulare TC 32-1]|uniref:Transmembrane protein n=1 Tax=Heterobasidion irregulare (strain TC 32-1) TaxID=747525 RepID=W4K2S3_HETIT|nr:uncharacterized protein HETIRDRAFT_321973 [Heterobasidion irregulare TC 32-1]ETW80034.1 hypothetical protein HETIRDRAFT_321973 [Heterobasidion irregulare TC 32-1]